MPLTLSLPPFDRAAADQAEAGLLAGIADGSLAFSGLPGADVTGLQELAAEAARAGRDLVVIGIGGSDLGARAVHRALNHQFWNLSPRFRAGRPRLFFMGDTTDPVAVGEALEAVEWTRAAVIMISKSGDTVEQMSSFLLARAALVAAVGAADAKRRIFTVTSAGRGTLRTITDQEGYRGAVIPDALGGRFSVLSSVGLLPLMAVGMDAAALLQGAAEAQGPAGVRTAAGYAAWQVGELRAGRPIHVLMPYAYGLREVGFWFRQLWAESLGKRLDRSGAVVHVGPTPVAALGPTDQHSQVQLYREGPDDKTYTLVGVEGGPDLTLPAAFPELEGVAYLGGRTLRDILSAEAHGTAGALREVGRPVAELSLPKLDAYELGGLLQFFMLATAAAGGLLEVDPFDQPGVERGKQLMFEKLGR